MAKGVGDPGFMAAPFFGQSSYDPIRSVKEAREREEQSVAARKKKLDASIEKGLKDLTFDIKGWEDTKGYDEISGELEELRSDFVDLGRKGLDLTSPSSNMEQKFSRAFQTKMHKLKQKNDLWQAQKKLYDEARTELIKDRARPENEQIYDHDEVDEKLEELLSTEGIMNRHDIYNNLLVPKLRPYDVSTEVNKLFKDLVPGVDKDVSLSLPDPISGKQIKTTVESVSEERRVAGMNKIYDRLSPAARKAVTRAYKETKEANPNMIENEKEWFIDEFSPITSVKKDKVVYGAAGSGRGGGYGLPAKDAQGNYPLQPQVRDLYFDTKGPSGDKVYPYESIGRVPIGATFSYKPISIMGSVNSMNTLTGEREGVGKSVPGVPVEANMFPVATEDMEISVADPKMTARDAPEPEEKKVGWLGGLLGRGAAQGEDVPAPYAVEGDRVIVSERIRAGERIPQHVLKAIRDINEEAKRNGRPASFRYTYKPYITFGLAYKQVRGEKGGDDVTNIFLSDPSGRTMSYTETSIVPYDEVREDLFAGAKENKQDWTPYDDYIQQMRNQINVESRIDKYLDLQEKSFDDIYKAVLE